MNEYGFSDCQVGMEESFETVITDKMLAQFCEMTDDTNPLHLDRAFAIEHGFSDRVAYGLLTLSFISKLAGVFLPGKYCVIQQIESKFSAPVYVGDKLNVRGVVHELHESVQQMEIRYEIRNQHGKRVVHGKLKVGFTRCD